MAWERVGSPQVETQNIAVFTPVQSSTPARSREWSRFSIVAANSQGASVNPYISIA